MGYVEKEAPEGVDCRLLLVNGINPANIGHITRRVELVASNVIKGPSKPAEGQSAAAHLEAYGGVVAGKSDAQLKKALLARVAEQNGMEFDQAALKKFVEFEYRGGRRVVFFIADSLGKDGIVKLRPQMEEEEEEFEAEVEVTDDEAEAEAKKKEEEEEAKKEEEKKKAEEEAAAKKAEEEKKKEE